MKIAIVINTIISKQVNIILENTYFSKNKLNVHDKSFKLTTTFFEFVEDLIGKGVIGNIDDCYVSIIDTNKPNELIDPMNKLLNILQSAQMNHK